MTTDGPLTDAELMRVLRTPSQDESLPPRILDAVHEATRTVPQRSRRWWVPMPPSARAMVTATTVVVVMLVGVIAVRDAVDRQDAFVPIGAAEEAGLPPPSGPAGNGLIAFARDGDIYVGDPASGKASPVVAGPGQDSGPIFSPDGTRIAFVRGEPWSDTSTIVVVRVDGSDEEVAVPPGVGVGPLSFAWTPDGAALVVNHADRSEARFFGGLLSMFDATGVAGARRLTPPLEAWPNAAYFNPNATVAPLFEPPAGDRILSDHDQISVMAPDGSDEEVLLDRTWLVEHGEPYVADPTWSPDASRIAFGGAEQVYVMDADGTDVHHVAGGYWPAWSPDGTKLAVERSSGQSAPDLAAEAEIVLVDMASLEERVLDATSVAYKTEGTPPADAAHRSWAYEGWSWSPDGSSILMLERHGTPPLVVDVETGEATELPWASDSVPSWQRVAAD